MSTVRIEEYLETIYEITSTSEENIVKVSDIKEALGLSSLASVTEMMQKLADERLIEYEKYKGVYLTNDGLKIAKDLEMKHNTIKQFFIKLGLDEDLATEDACKIEHIISKKTINVIIKLVEFMNHKNYKQIFQEFRTYYIKSKEEE